MIIKADAWIHGGDYDCSEAVRMSWRAVGILPYGCYMYTGNQIELMTTYGFVVVRDLSKPRIGDVLWRNGHTEMYLGDGMQGGARIAETGGINGTKGDQNSREVTMSAYRAGDWELILRYNGSATYEGIPVAIAAAKVMLHIIEHAAHGYSQPNRAGDGTVERITIEWDDGAGDTIAASFRWRFDRDVRVRKAPSTHAETLESKWHEGDVATADGIAIADGCVWLTYVGPSTGLRLYAAIQQKGTTYGRVVA